MQNIVVVVSIVVFSSTNPVACGMLLLLLASLFCSTDPAARRMLLLLLLALLHSSTDPVAHRLLALLPLLALLHSSTDPVVPECCYCCCCCFLALILKHTQCPKASAAGSVTTVYLDMPKCISLRNRAGPRHRPLQQTTSPSQSRLPCHQHVNQLFPITTVIIIMLANFSLSPLSSSLC